MSNDNRRRFQPVSSVQADVKSLHEWLHFSQQTLEEKTESYSSGIPQGRFLEAVLLSTKWVIRCCSVCTASVLCPHSR